MYCPMKFNSNTLDKTGYTENESCQCEKEYCAFWNENVERCAILSINYSLISIKQSLEIGVNIGYYFMPYVIPNKQA